jgi:hypothetical protein
MRKIFALALALTLVSGLYGLKLGLGAAYAGLLDDHYTEYLSIKADMRVPLLSSVDVRATILNFDMPTDAKAIHLGTFTSSDLMFKIPMEGSLKPYVAAGLWFNYGLDAETMDLALKAAIGAEMGLGGLNAFIEAGLGPFSYTKDADPSTHNPMYVQAGIILPVGD